MENSILSEEEFLILTEQCTLCKDLDGSTAEIGVFEGFTSKMIISIIKRKHYCYDTFEGIKGSNILYGDKHVNGDFYCSLDRVRKNINMKNVVYKKGYFPETFQEYLEKFSFVYSDTATYIGTKNTFLYFSPCMILGGKMVFYVDDNNSGVKKACDEFKNEDFIKIKNQNFIIFTKMK